MQIKKLLFFLLPFVSVAGLYSYEYELPAPESDSYIFYSADELNYDSAAKTLSLNGDVNLVVTQPSAEETRLYTQNLTIDQNKKTVFADGEVKVEQDSGVLTGRDLSLNYETKDMQLKDIKANYPPIRLLGADSAEVKNGKQVYKGAKITCCSEEDPHYYMKVGSVSMSPQKRVFGTNAFLYLSDIPVFYLPVFWRSLDSQKPFTTYVDFTQSGKTGWGLLTSTVFYPIEHLRTTINLDGYTQSGIGYGTQLLVENSENVIGNLEAYAIDDQETNASRWGISGGYWAQLFDNSDSLNREDGGARYTTQGQFRSVSDPYFNDTFFRGNPYKFMPDQDISFAFSRQSRTSMMRASYSQKDEFNSAKDAYETIEKTLPRLEYQIMPFTLPLGIVNNFSVNLYNTKIEDEEYQQTAAVFWKSARAFKINRRMTLTPYVTLDERANVKDPEYEDKDSYVSRLGAGANLRTELPTGSLDVSYNYIKRFATSSFNEDYDSPDKGEETSTVRVQNYYRPSFNTYFRVGTGYDMRENNAEDWALKTRMEPLLAELGYNSSDGKVNLFVQNIYDFEDGNQSFLAQSDFRIFKASHMVFGMNNHANDIDSYLFNAKFWFRPIGYSWYFDAGLDFEVKQGEFTAYSKSLRFYKDFHDAHIELRVEDRNENLSFGVRINILCGKGRRENTFAQEDRYWSPWRSPGDLRD